MVHMIMAPGSGEDVSVHVALCTTPGERFW